MLRKEVAKHNSRQRMAKMHLQSSQRQLSTKLNVFYLILKHCLIFILVSPTTNMFILLFNHKVLEVYITLIWLGMAIIQLSERRKNADKLKGNMFTFINT